MLFRRESPPRDPIVMKTFLKLILFCLLLFPIKRFCHQQTDGFTLTKVTSSFPPSPSWELPILQKEEERKLESLLSQPFIFLGSGGQMYAFLSEDKKTVLKLYKMHHLISYSWLEKLPLPSYLDRYRTAFLENQRKKRENLFNSSYLAMTELKEQTGLIYLQINPHPNSYLTVQLIDKLGIPHQLALNKTPFVLQEFADNPFKKLRQDIKNNDLLSAKKTIQQMIDCLTERYKKGILDTDPALRRNLGLFKDRAIFIDIGSFLPSIHSEPLPISDLLYQDTRRMNRWLQKRSLPLKLYLDQLIEESAPQTRKQS